MTRTHDGKSINTIQRRASKLSLNKETVRDLVDRESQEGFIFSIPRSNCGSCGPITCLTGHPCPAPCA